jgi:hypothetical protein
MSYLRHKSDTCDVSLTLFSVVVVVVVVVIRQPLKKEASTPSHLLERVQPHDTSYY